MCFISNLSHCRGQSFPLFCVAEIFSVIIRRIERTKSRLKQIFWLTFLAFLGLSSASFPPSSSPALSSLLTRRCYKKQLDNNTKTSARKPEFILSSGFWRMCTRTTRPPHVHSWNGRNHSKFSFSFLNRNLFDQKAIRGRRKGRKKRQMKTKTTKKWKKKRETKTHTLAHTDSLKCDHLPNASSRPWSVVRGLSKHATRKSTGWAKEKEQKDNIGRERRKERERERENWRFSHTNTRKVFHWEEKNKVDPEEWVHTN